MHTSHVTTNNFQSKKKTSCAKQWQVERRRIIMIKLDNVFEWILSQLLCIDKFVRRRSFTLYKERKIPNTKNHSPNNVDLFSYCSFSNQNIKSNSNEGVTALRVGSNESLLKFRRICFCTIGCCFFGTYKNGC